MILTIHRWLIDITTIYKLLQNITVEVKKEVILQISVNSNPPSQITWEFNGEAVEDTEASDGRSVSKLVDGSLKLTQVSMDDAGVWTIIANNDVESVVRREIFLEVNPERTNITVGTYIHSKGLIGLSLKAYRN